VRGWRNQARHVEVIGAADRVANLASAVAFAAARNVIAGGFASGVRVLGDEESPNDAVLHDVLDAGVRLSEFVGTSSH
jgi:hypothetical protein